MKPVSPGVQVANMNDPVAKDVETTAATAAVSEISEATDIPKECETPNRNLEALNVATKTAAVMNMKKHSQESMTCAGAEFTDTSTNETSEGSDLPDEQKSVNRDTEASETELAANNDTSEPFNAQQSGKKKKGRKINWTSVPLEFPPHRPTGRGKGRKRGRGQGSTGPAEERERRPEAPAPVENLAPIGTRGRGSQRGGRRGGRGRAPQYYRELNYLTDPSPQFCYYPTTPPLWVVYKQLKEQVEFYFYNPKLAEDFFLRRNMDSLGYVELSKIAGFDQISKIAQGLHNVVGLLVQALQPSELLELSVDKQCVRRKFSPEKWILGNNPSVFSSLRPDAPEFVFEPTGSKKNEEKDEDQNTDAKENGDTAETTASIAQNSDLAEKTAEKSTENSTENSTDLTQDPELSDTAPAGEESHKTVGTITPDVTGDVKTTENSDDDVQGSKERKDSKSREDGDNI